MKLRPARNMGGQNTTTKTKRQNERALGISEAELEIDEARKKTTNRQK